MSGDANEARKLLVEKAALRNTELAAVERDLDRLREGRPDRWLRRCALDFDEI